MQVELYFQIILGVLFSPVELLEAWVFTNLYSILYILNVSGFTVHHMTAVVFIFSLWCSGIYRNPWFSGNTFFFLARSVIIVEHFNGHICDAGSNPCELNCVPSGENFFYRHKPAVVDGTPCYVGRDDICVDGECRVGTKLQPTF